MRDWNKIILGFIVLVIIAAIIDSCTDIQDKMRNSYAERNQLNQLVVKDMRRRSICTFTIGKLDEGMACRDKILGQMSRRDM